MIALYELNRQLIGDIKPCEDSVLDQSRFDNLSRQTALVDALLQDIVEIANRYEGRKESSVKMIRDRAVGFLEYIHNEYRP